MMGYLKPPFLGFPGSSTPCPGKVAAPKEPLKSTEKAAKLAHTHLMPALKEGGTAPVQQAKRWSRNGVGGLQWPKSETISDDRSIIGGGGALSLKKYTYNIHTRVYFVIIF